MENEKAIKKAIRESLSNLSYIDYKTFCSELPCPPFFKAELQTAEQKPVPPVDVSELLWTRCSGEALPTTITTLRTSRCVDAADKLEAEFRLALTSMENSSSVSNPRAGNSVAPKVEKRRLSPPPSEPWSAKPSKVFVQSDKTSTQKNVSADEEMMSLPQPETYEDENYNDGQLDDEVYCINNNPPPICLILNNINFDKSDPRNGSEKDAESLGKVFSWLGFTVLMYEDKTREEMLHILECFSTLRNVSELEDVGLKKWSDGRFVYLRELPPLKHGDAFVCCILSHGRKGVVQGIRWGKLPIKEITRTFKASDISPLSEKPKVFLIQACQGEGYQGAVLEKDGNMEFDYVRNTYPEEADVLVAFSTVEDCASARDPDKGTWFIQSLCPALETGCKRGDDIHTILQRVNREVAKKEGYDKKGKLVKQMPEVHYTLRKTLKLTPPVNMAGTSYVDLR